MYVLIIATNRYARSVTVVQALAENLFLPKISFKEKIFVEINETETLAIYRSLDSYGPSNRPLFCPRRTVCSIFVEVN